MEGLNRKQVSIIICAILQSRIVSSHRLLVMMMMMFNNYNDNDDDDDVEYILMN